MAERESHRTSWRLVRTAVGLQHPLGHRRDPRDCWNRRSGSREGILYRILLIEVGLVVGLCGVSVFCQLASNTAAGQLRRTCGLRIPAAGTITWKRQANAR